MNFKRTKLNRAFGNYQPDWEGGDVWVEVKLTPRSVSVVREGVLQLAYALSDRPELKAFLLLIDPYTTKTRLDDEWSKVERTLRPDILKRLCIVVYEKGAILGIPRDPDAKIRQELLEICQEEAAERKRPLPKPDYKAEIYKILIYKWLEKAEPMTSDWLAHAAGCNYRTVANALESVGNALFRHSDRRVELKYFPKEVWEWLLVHLDKSRLTRRYSDRSGNPRSVESLLKRLAKMEHSNIAVAGSIGAQHHYPDVDVIGIPRLDLSIHCPDKYINLDFIEKLDPALKEETDREAPATVVLHLLRRKESFFKENPDGIAWADPVECILDLHEMRMEPQALGFLNYLQNRGGA